jgi:phosphatidylserine/phosphatidylglycerophosphate/cardiolipin synthase-like enzyme
MPNEIGELLNYRGPEKVTSTKNFEVMGIPAFVTEFGARANEAKKRVLLQTMYLFPSHFSDLLLNALELGAKRGLQTALITDGITQPLRGRDQLYVKILGEKTDKAVDVKAVTQMEARLEQTGVKKIESRPFTNLNKLIFAFKRNHFKMGVVDGTAWVGGLNAGKQSDYNRIDFMMRLTDKDLVDKIAKLMVSPESLKADFSEKIGEVELVVDAGVPGKSAIMARVIKQVEAIKDPVHAQLNLITPWVPDGELLEVLVAAKKRGVKITIYTSHHRFQIGLEGIYALVKNLNTLVMSIKRKQLPVRYTSLEVHGKMMTIQDGDEKLALITTNNFTEKGVIMGTAEIALLSSNSDFIGSCEAFVKKVDAVSSDTRVDTI